MKTILAFPTILILLQNHAAARDDIPLLRGAIQHAYVQRSDYWSQFTNAIDVHGNDLSPVIDAAATKNDIIIFETYAEWCGHCQNMAPKFDGAAKYFNQVGGLVLAKGQCDNNHQLCEDLGVVGFPTFYYGTADDFRDIREGNPPGQIEQLRSMSSADTMIDFLVQRFGIESTSTPKDESHHDTTPTKNNVTEATAPLYTIAVDAYLSDIEKSTSDSLTQALVSTHLIAKAEARQGFIDWQTWIADSHPSDKCRMGAQDILDDLNDLWPEQNYSPATVRLNLLTKNQCISDYSNVQYQGCAAGGNPGAYTCGLWQTFHAMSVSPNSRLTGEEMFSSLGQFIKFFFTCTICQEHFLGMMASVDQTTVQLQDDFIVWLWEAHNEVNERLRDEELGANTFNADRPKGLFPSPEVCQNCLDDREGNYVGPYVGEHNHILPFLDEFYGQDLV
jgi:thiol-disulfide isomerase/thioredoxin